MSRHSWINAGTACLEEKMNLARTPMAALPQDTAQRHLALVYLKVMRPLPIAGVLGRLTEAAVRRA